MIYLSEDVFIITLEYKEFSEEDMVSETEVLWADKTTLKFIKKLFRVIKSEMSEVSQVMNLQEKSDSDKYFRVISNNFNLNDDNIRDRIIRRIKRLKQFNFRSGGLTVHFDEIVEMIKSLRFKRIKFWENLLDDFTKNKDFYLAKIKNQMKKFP